MDDNKFSITYEDYLPNGTSWEALDKALVNKPVEFTRENLAKIIDPKFLDLSEEEFEDFVKKHENIKSLFSTTHFNAPQHRLSSYAEDLDKNDELNQEFPAPEDK